RNDHRGTPTEKVSVNRKRLCLPQHLHPGQTRVAAPRPSVISRKSSGLRSLKEAPSEWTSTAAPGTGSPVSASVTRKVTPRSVEPTQRIVKRKSTRKISPPTAARAAPARNSRFQRFLGTPHPLSGPPREPVDDVAPLDVLSGGTEAVLPLRPPVR